MLNVMSQTVTDAELEGLPSSRAVSFAGCFGWLHGAASASGPAILLCPGVKHDAMTGHRPLRMLAETLAAAGFPVLRFDYPGTGDSLDPGDVEHWAFWQKSVHLAADWLRDQSGSLHVVLGGLRLGATLATLVAGQRDDVAGLLLIAPVLRGRTWIRQLSVEAKLHDPDAQRDGGLVLHELVLSRQTVELINQVDLRKQRLKRDCQVNVYAEAPTPILNDCASAWRDCGAVVACEDFTGLAPMLRPVFLNHEAPIAAARIAGRLHEALPNRPARRLSAPMAEPAELHPPGCIETPVTFGPQSRLFGVLCRPRSSEPADLVVVIGNSSGDPHSGFARVATQFARHFAAEGLASLRMDFAGIGDSIAPDDAGTHVFETDRRADYAAAIDALYAQGFRRFALAGLCSGAYHALRAALADRRVGTLVLVNLPLFEWQHGAPIEYLQHSVEQKTRLWQKLRRKDVWQRLLGGEADLRSRLAALQRSVGGKATGVFWRMAARLGAKPPESFARTSLRILSGRTKTLFLCGENDMSLANLEQEFGRGRMPVGATLRVVAGIDHALTGRAMQKQAAMEIAAFLKKGSK